MSPPPKKSNALSILGCGVHALVRLWAPGLERNVLARGVAQSFVTLCGEGCHGRFVASAPSGSVIAGVLLLPVGGWAGKATRSPCPGPCPTWCCIGGAFVGGGGHGVFSGFGTFARVVAILCRGLCCLVAAQRLQGQSPPGLAGAHG